MCDDWCVSKKWNKLSIQHKIYVKITLLLCNVCVGVVGDMGRHEGCTCKKSFGNVENVSSRLVNGQRMRSFINMKSRQ